jgi:hypothetical protein
MLCNMRAERVFAGTQIEWLVGEDVNVISLLDQLLARLMAKGMLR